MANLRTAGFRNVIPTLKASDLKGADRTIITVKSAEPIPNPNPGKGNTKKQLLELKMHEWPDRVYYPNPTGIGTLMEMFGDETNLWRDKQIPLIVELTINPQTGEEVEALHVAPASRWDDLLSEANAQEETKSTRKRPARK